MLLIEKSFALKHFQHIISQRHFLPPLFTDCFLKISSWEFPRLIIAIHPSLFETNQLILSRKLSFLCNTSLHILLALHDPYSVVILVIPNMFLCPTFIQSCVTSCCIHPTVTLMHQGNIYFVLPMSWYMYCVKLLYRTSIVQHPNQYEYIVKYGMTGYEL